MEWEVVGVIVVLVGLIATVSGPMIKLNSTLNYGRRFFWRYDVKIIK